MLDPSSNLVKLWAVLSKAVVTVRRRLLGLEQGITLLGDPRSLRGLQHPQLSLVHFHRRASGAPCISLLIVANGTIE
jgi:hypothetical protein